MVVQTRLLILERFYVPFNAGDHPVHFNELLRGICKGIFVFERPSLVLILNRKVLILGKILSGRQALILDVSATSSLSI